MRFCPRLRSSALIRGGGGGLGLDIVGGGGGAIGVSLLMGGGGGGGGDLVEAEFDVVVDAVDAELDGPACAFISVKREI